MAGDRKCEKNTEVERKERMESVERKRSRPERQNKRGEFSKCEGSDDEVEFHKPTKILSNEMKSKESLR